MANMGSLLRDVEVDVKVAPLLLKLLENKEKYIKVRQEALKTYSTLVDRELEDRLKAHRKAGPGKETNLTFNIPYPTDFSEEYDTLMQFLKAVVGQTVTLEKSQYDAIMNDYWDFTRSVDITNRVLMTSMGKYL